MATKFTYKMRLGGKWDVGSGTRPTQTNKKKNKKKMRAVPCRRGEMFLFMHRQMLARYNAERIALGMALVEAYDR